MNELDVRKQWLDELGGEPLEGSGFEKESPNLAYSNDHRGQRLHSTKREEANNVH